MQDMEVCYTLIGHSERRSKYGETDEDTATKVEKCQAAGLKVLFCIGDLLEEREAGKTDEVNKRQLSPKSRTGMTSSLPDPVVASVGHRYWQSGHPRQRRPQVAALTSRQH